MVRVNEEAPNGAAIPNKRTRPNLASNSPRHAKSDPPLKNPVTLLEDGSSDSDEDFGLDHGGVPLNGRTASSHDDDTTFKINEDYARKFMHNKKREDLLRRELIYFRL